MASTSTQSTANPSPGETKPSPAQQPGILQVSAEMIARQGTKDVSAPTLGEPAVAQNDGGGGDAGGANVEANAPGAAQQESVANTKENTPMGLLNSIGRFNNFKPNYELVKEEGPAHQKQFTVQLKFGEESYTGVGTSIKRAQHEAAQKALDTCKLPTPEKKTRPSGYRLLKSPNTNALTPTVQLNSYSLKTGVAVKYSVINTTPSYPPGGYRKPLYQPQQQQHRYSNNTNAPQQHPQGGGGGDAPNNEQEVANPLNAYHGPRQPNTMFRGPPPLPQDGMGIRPRGPRGPGPYNYMHYGSPYEMRPIYRQRFRRPYPQVFSVKLSVGNREFIGQGMNQRAARQDAAEKAMQSVTESPFPVKKDQATSMLENDTKEKPLTDNTDGDGTNKSEISQVYEVANFNGLNLEFKVLDESGPPHQKEYKIQCTVGNITVEEVGSSKKEAKRKAAASVLPKLQALPPPVKATRPGPRVGWRPPPFKKPSITKKNAEDPDFGAVGMNPISRLVQICQAKKLKDPLFEVLSDQPIPDRRVHPTIYRHIFTMQVTVDDKKAEGKGATKKEAKKEAAEAMLVLMNYKASQPDTPVPGADATPGKPVLKQPQTNGEAKKEEDSPNADRKVTFKDDQTTAPPVVKREEEPPKPEIIPGSQQGSQIPGITPGLFPMMPGVKTIPPPFQQPPPPQQQPQGLNRAPGAPVSTTHAVPRNFNPALSADIASELLLTHRSLTAQTILQSKNLPIQMKSTRPQHMLEYMGAVTGLDITFTDFPQSNQSEFLTEVRISTDPPVRFHGTSHSMDAAHDLASLNVLRALAGCPPEESTRVVPPTHPLVQQGRGLSAQ